MQAEPQNKIMQMLNSAITVNTISTDQMTSHTISHCNVTY